MEICIHIMKPSLRTYHCHCLENFDGTVFIFFTLRLDELHRTSNLVIIFLFASLTFPTVLFIVWGLCFIPTKPYMKHYISSGSFSMCDFQKFSSRPHDHTMGVRPYKSRFSQFWWKKTPYIFGQRFPKRNRIPSPIYVDRKKYVCHEINRPYFDLCNIQGEAVYPRVRRREGELSRIFSSSSCIFFLKFSQMAGNFFRKNLESRSLPFWALASERKI